MQSIKSLRLFASVRSPRRWTKANYGNLHQMVTETLSHIDARFESLCGNLTAELEARPYGELAAMEEMTYSKPELEDIGKSRARH